MNMQCRKPFTSPIKCSPSKSRFSYMRKAQHAFQIGTSDETASQLHDSSSAGTMPKDSTLTDTGTALSGKFPKDKSSEDTAQLSISALKKTPRKQKTVKESAANNVLRSIFRVRLSSEPRRGVRFAACEPELVHVYPGERLMRSLHKQVIKNRLSIDTLTYVDIQNPFLCLPEGLTSDSEGPSIASIPPDTEDMQVEAVNDNFAEHSGNGYNYKQFRHNDSLLFEKKKTELNKNTCSKVSENASFDDSSVDMSSTFPSSDTAPSFSRLGSVETELASTMSTVPGTNTHIYTNTDTDTDKQIHTLDKEIYEFHLSYTQTHTDTDTPEEPVSSLLERTLLI